jgi:hypothetical protein
MGRIRLTIPLSACPPEYIERNIEDIIKGLGEPFRQKKANAAECGAP